MTQMSPIMTNQINPSLQPMGLQYSPMIQQPTPLPTAMHVQHPPMLGSAYPYSMPHPSVNMGHMHNTMLNPGMHMGNPMMSSSMPPHMMSSGMGVPPPINPMMSSSMGMSPTIPVGGLPLHPVSPALPITPAMSGNFRSSPIVGPAVGESAFAASPMAGEDSQQN